MEKPIRILVANQPRLMRELILETLADQPDFEIVGEVAEKSKIPENVQRTLPNFVVIALDHPGRRPAICEELLREHPDLRVIAVAPEKNCFVYYWASLEIHSRDVEASEEGLLTAIRHMAESHGAVSGHEAVSE
jgi:chemotaxis response regulator CheB